MPILSLINQKGGVGKTTSAINLSCSLAKLNQKVLLIDLDPQANTSCGLGLLKNEKDTSYDLLINQKKVSPLSLHGINVIPSSLRLITAEIELNQKIARENFLKKAISFYKENYDFIILDCPPSLSLLTINALVSSERAYIPIETEIFALEGISQLFDTISSLQEVNPNLSIGGVFITKYDKRNKSKEKYIKNLKEIFDKDLLETKIRLNISLSKSQEEGLPVLYYSPKSFGSQDYESLAREILKREKGLI